MDAKTPLRHGQVGYFSLGDLPQRPSIEAIAYGSGWWELDQIFKFYPGQLVVVSGISTHGKSTFLLNILAKVACEQGIRSFAYVPENEDHLYDKVRKLWPGNEASFGYFANNQCFVQSSLPQDDYDEPARTLRWVLEQAVTAIERDGVGIVLIDPWNQLDRAKPKDQLLTDYIGESLVMAKAFCRLFNVTVIIVAHPTKAVTENGGRIPSLADIEGSMNWFNKCDNGLIVHRHAENDSAQVISAKVREIGAGKKGVCHFKVDPATGVFTPMYGGVTL